MPPRASGSSRHSSRPCRVHRHFPPRARSPARSAARTAKAAAPPASPGSGGRPPGWAAGSTAQIRPRSSRSGTRRSARRILSPSGGLQQGPVPLRVAARLAAPAARRAEEPPFRARPPVQAASTQRLGFWGSDPQAPAHQEIDESHEPQEQSRFRPDRHFAPPLSEMGRRPRGGRLSASDPAGNRSPGAQSCPSTRIPSASAGPPPCRPPWPGPRGTVGKSSAGGSRSPCRACGSWGRS